MEPIEVEISLKGFNYPEKQIMNKILDVHNSFMELEKQHPADTDDWFVAIHQMQRIMAMRIARKVEPSIFPIVKE